MSWICPYCGYENESERIGRREPACKRCQALRKDPDELEKESKFQLRRLDRDIDEIKGRLNQKAEMISDLENDLSELKAEYQEIVSDMIDLQMERDEIPTTIYREKVRACPEIIKEQTRLCV